ncbi:hypothetical protein CSKR_108622 [Clonorchis sinensis]|uniref:Uncharacterized protein n=1 Tax=Clonorchis sinensis TaxID=79923 RepID=A0A419Q3J3_CLOSI|nr:hypothetical protein CSKR_108622 [Clonorchis sinensis]
MGPKKGETGRGLVKGLRQPYRQRLRNMQCVTAWYQTQTARVSVDQGQTTPPQYAARDSLVLEPDSAR